MPILSRSARGEIKTDKGKPSHRFYLGYDPKEAEDRKGRLETLWSLEPGKWTPLGIAIGKAIARGDDEVNVDDFIDHYAGDQHDRTSSCPQESANPLPSDPIDGHR